MTRYLSSLLGAEQPLFSHSLAELERASGSPGVDIRLSSELMRQARLKIAKLGLDPDDTTGPELYSALQVRLSQDDVAVRLALGIPSGAVPLDVLSKVQKFIDNHEITSCFALKAVTAKKLFKKKVPKATMKRLGYRSLESMLKHEPVVMIYAAATIAESPAWHKLFKEQYAKLQASDFEQRQIAVILPKTKRWTDLSKDYVLKIRHNILCLREFGAVVMLPMPTAIDGLAITTLLLSLYYMNDIHAYSSFIKLQQVRPDFGKVVQDSSGSEPMTHAELAGQPVSWKVIQRYYGRTKQGEHPEVFEPHVQADDLTWRDGETVLAELQPILDFWQDSQYICMLSKDGPVSFNILDVALSYCNHLPFANRIIHFAREHIWHELMSRYLHQANLEAAVHEQLSRSLIDETTLAQ